MRNNTINKLIEDAVNLYPNNIAVKYKNKSLTYRELNAMANKKANYLISLGTKKRIL